MVKFSGCIDLRALSDNCSISLTLSSVLSIFLFQMCAGNVYDIYETQKHLISLQNFLAKLISNEDYVPGLEENAQQCVNYRTCNDLSDIVSCSNGGWGNMWS